MTAAGTPPPEQGGTRTTGAETVSVIVCAYTERRWDDLVAACRSLATQTRPPDEVVLVVDHCDALLRRARVALPAVRVVPNTDDRGLSGARNTGVRMSAGEILLFLDDDATADPDWVERLTAPFADPDVIGAGGWAEPRWDARGRPDWFPEPFLWVVGCSYQGLPAAGSAIRNPLGCAMAFRRAAFDLAGDFSGLVGRVGRLPAGCEETEFSIRALRAKPGTRIVHEPAARVRHHVTADRTRLSYFLRRCWHEGRSKAVLSAYLGAADSLASERDYVRHTLPGAVAGGLRRSLATGRPAGAASALAVVGGLAVTAAGYGVARLSRVRRPAGPGTGPESGPESGRDPMPAAIGGRLGGGRLGGGRLGGGRLRSGTVPAPDRAGERLPVWCTEFELAGPLPAALTAPTGGFASVRVLVRLHGQPLGQLQAPLDRGSVTVSELLARADAALLDRVGAHLAGDGLAPAATLPPDGLPTAPAGCPQQVVPDLPVTVVVCTRDRAGILRGCLARMRTLDHPSLEVVVVDNAPTGDATRAAFVETVGDDPRFRYVVEPGPGLSRARNRGLAEASGAVIAYTDDDVSVDPSWVRAVARGFAGEDVACVTGLVCTAAIDGPAEAYFDARVSWADSWRPHVYRLGSADDRGLFPYSPGIFGTGANFAFRTDVLRALGGFDEALGAGTATLGGEDLDAFVRVLQAGHALAFTPDALVWHHHRADLPSLRRHVYGYGTGLSAFVAKHLADPATRTEVLRRIPRGLARLAAVPATTSRSLGERPPVRPGGLLLREFAGMAAGPARYLRARRAVSPSRIDVTGRDRAGGARATPGEGVPCG